MDQDQYVREFRDALQKSDPRASLSARLKLLMPRIQERIANGTPYAAILADLEVAGFPVKPRLLERVLYRWRKAQRPGASQQIAAEPQPPAEAADPIKHRHQRIETPADLRQIRDMRVDLEALRQEGMERRRGK